MIIKLGLLKINLFNSFYLFILSLSDPYLLFKVRLFKNMRDFHYMFQVRDVCVYRGTCNIG